MGGRYTVECGEVRTSRHRRSNQKSHEFGVILVLQSCGIREVNSEAKLV